MPRPCETSDLSSFTHGYTRIPSHVGTHDSHVPDTCGTCDPHENRERHPEAPIATPPYLLVYISDKYFARVLSVFAWVSLRRDCFQPSPETIEGDRITISRPNEGTEWTSFLLLPAFSTPNVPRLENRKSLKSMDLSQRVT